MRRLPRYFAPAIAVAVALLGCGRAHPTARSERHLGTERPLSKVTAALLGSLPSAVEDAASAGFDSGRVVLLGGLDAADTSTASITVLDGGSATPVGLLPAAQHDAQATRLGQDVFVFGGGQVSSYDHILRYDPASGTVAQVATLPSPASDVAVAALRGVAYVVGGYDGSNALDTILAWQPGRGARVVALLPSGLRYAAVAAIGSRLIIAGGTTPNGPSDAILSFDPATGAVDRIGTLPVPLTHASAAALDDRVLVIGGRRELTGAEVSSITAVDPTTGSATLVGHLPHPLADAAAVALGDRVIVAGGETSGEAVSTVLALTPQPPEGRLGAGK